MCDESRAYTDAQIVARIACMRHHIAPTLLLLSIGLLAGCGQKGPLFLPAKPVAPASASTSAPALSTAKPAPAMTSGVPASASSSGD